METDYSQLLVSKTYHCFSMDLYAEVVDTLPEENDEKVEADELSAKKDLTSTELVDGRLKRRAKRPSKYLMKTIKDSTMVTNNVSSSPNNGTGRLAKNMRRPRNGYGRGLAKKGVYLFIPQIQFISLDIIFQKMNTYD